MPVVRMTPLKEFLANPLSTSDVSTGYDLGQLSSGQMLRGALHLTAAYAATDRVVVAKIQTATASGFGAPSDRITFALSTGVGSTWGAPAAGASTEHRWVRASWTMSTAASTGGTWKGLIEAGIAT
jgi:hypothetical protein